MAIRIELDRIEAYNNHILIIYDSNNVARIYIGYPFDVTDEDKDLLLYDFILSHPEVV